MAGHLWRTLHGGQSVLTALRLRFDGSVSSLNSGSLNVKARSSLPDYTHTQAYTHTHTRTHTRTHTPGTVYTHLHHPADPGTGKGGSRMVSSGVNPLPSLPFPSLPSPPFPFLPFLSPPLLSPPFPPLRSRPLKSS